MTKAKKVPNAKIAKTAKPKGSKRRVYVKQSYPMYKCIARQRSSGRIDFYSGDEGSQTARWGGEKVKHYVTGVESTLKADALRLTKHIGPTDRLLVLDVRADVLEFHLPAKKTKRTPRKSTQD